MRRWLLLAVVLAACAVVVTFFVVHPALAPESTSKATPQPQPAPSSPLAIAAVRAHPTPGGTITITNQLPPRSGCPTAVISYPSDGLTLYALLTTPPTPKPNGGYPVVVLAHGFINPASYSTTGTDYQTWIAQLCNAGYLVIKPDFRGNGQSQGDPVGGHFSAGYTYDLLNLVASLKTLPEANPSLVALIGHSMGGDVVLRSLVAPHGLPIKAAVIVSGAMDSLYNMAYSWPNSPPDVVADKASFIKTYGTPAQAPAVWHDASSINYVSQITIPVQIDVGSSDSVVPPAFSAHLDSALTGARINHQYYVYPGGDHQFSNPADAALLGSRIKAFLAANL
jgi:uncharacterized protein